MPTRTASGQGGIDLLEKTSTRVEKPRLYRVLVHNDDYTPFEIVILILERVFNMNTEQAATVTMLVHTSGIGLAGVFPFDIAETKQHEAMDLAKSGGFPLQISIEPEA